jgi:transposase InsO family protein
VLWEAYSNRVQSSARQSFDAVYGDIFIRRLQSMGIRDRPTAARSPWQNGCAERLIGSIRRDCLDYVVVFGERHLRHPLESYQRYYNEARTHLSLSKDAPVSMGILGPAIIAIAIVLIIVLVFRASRI